MRARVVSMTDEKYHAACIDCEFQIHCQGQHKGKFCHFVKSDGTSKKNIHPCEGTENL